MQQACSNSPISTEESRSSPRRHTHTLHALNSHVHHSCAGKINEKTHGNATGLQFVHEKNATKSLVMNSTSTCSQTHRQHTPVKRKKKKLRKFYFKGFHVVSNIFCTKINNFDVEFCKKKKKENIYTWEVSFLSCSSEKN